MSAYSRFRGWNFILLYGESKAPLYHHPRPLSFIQRANFADIVSRQQNTLLLFLFWTMVTSYKKILFVLTLFSFRCKMPLSSRWLGRSSNLNKSRGLYLAKLDVPSPWAPFFVFVIVVSRGRDRIYALELALANRVRARHRVLRGSLHKNELGNVWIRRELRIPARTEAIRPNGTSFRCTERRVQSQFTCECLRSKMAPGCHPYVH